MISAPISTCALTKNIFIIIGGKEEYLSRDKAETVIALAQKRYNKEFIKQEC